MTTVRYTADAAIHPPLVRAEGGLDLDERGDDRG
jgi:hypothetical protein